MGHERKWPGYSPETPLAKKLGIKPDSTVLLHCRAASTIATGSLRCRKAFRSVTKSRAGQCDLVHLFCESLSDLKRFVAESARSHQTRRHHLGIVVQEIGKIPTDVTEDEVRRFALATDLVDVRRLRGDGRLVGIEARGAEAFKVRFAVVICASRCVATISSELTSACGEGCCSRRMF